MKNKKILWILIPLLLIGGGVFALTRKKKPIPTPPKRKPATIIVGDMTGAIDPFSEFATGNYFFTRQGAEMWSYPSTTGSDLLKTYPTEESVYGLQIGTFNGEDWIQVDDYDTKDNIGWIRQSQLFQSL